MVGVPRGLYRRRSACPRGPRLPLPLRDRLDHVGLLLRVLGRRFRDTPGLDTATRDDVIHITARAELALDLAHVDAAKRELERLKTLARRCGVPD
ncbi:hypothetical protein [Streptomyces acidiscabies]|uniref:hypothetical protein n=1 Tax=Streptomyces acidiscabies TaxID=42234 RepID=UPI0038F81A08